MISFTTVIGVDKKHLGQLRMVWETWKRFRPEILEHPLLLMCDDCYDERRWAEELKFLNHPSASIQSWGMQAVSQREKMLSALVFGPARHIETPWYLKLDTDVVALGPSKWIQDEWFEPDKSGRQPVFVSSPWGYTKPGHLIDDLDRWAATVPDLAKHEDLGISPKSNASLVRHKRIASWCFFGQTSWTRQMASYCGDRLPVPSQDTFLWYCAQRRGDSMRRVRMRKFNWTPVLRNRKIAELVAQAGCSTQAQADNGHPPRREAVNCVSTANNSDVNSQERAPTGVVYLLTGASHGARLVVSMNSLRRHYDGPIALFTTQPESHRMGELCASDPVLRVDHRRFDQIKARKNSSLLTKLAILSHAPFEKAVFLDADTLVVGKLDELFDYPNNEVINAVRFATWHTTGKIMKRRISRWRDLKQDEVDQDWIDELVQDSLVSRPAVNIGVFGYRADSSILHDWFRLAKAGEKTFICDEIACQLLLPQISHRILDARFNSSPVHSAEQADVRIWHFHGDKHLNRERSRNLWFPEYLNCVEKNVAQIAEWTPGKDKHLRRFLGKHSRHSQTIKRRSSNSNGQPPEPRYQRRWFHLRNRPTYEDKVRACWAGRRLLTYLEIGVFEGAAMRWMLENVLTHPTSRSIGIAQWPTSEKLVRKLGKKRALQFMKDARSNAIHNLSHFADRAAIIRGQACKVLQKLAERDPHAKFSGAMMGDPQRLWLNGEFADIVMIDGDHNSDMVFQNAESVLPLVAPGGWIMFNDFRNRIPKQNHVEDGYYQFLNEHLDAVDELWESDHIICVRKK